MKKGGLSESLLRGFWLGQFEVSRDTGSELGRTALRDCFGRQTPALAWFAKSFCLHAEKLF